MKGRNLMKIHFVTMLHHVTRGVNKLAAVAATQPLQHWQLASNTSYQTSPSSGAVVGGDLQVSVARRDHMWHAATELFTAENYMEIYVCAAPQGTEGASKTNIYMYTTSDNISAAE